MPSADALSCARNSALLMSFFLALPPSAFFSAAARCAWDTALNSRTTPLVAVCSSLRSSWSLLGSATPLMGTT